MPWLAQYQYKLQRTLNSDVAKAALLAAVWQIALSIIGIVFAYLYDRSSIATAFTAHLNHWDAGWYLHIISHGYGLSGSPAAPAFYPLFPLLTGGLSWLTFGLIPPLIAGQIINTVGLWLLLLAFIKILRHFPVSRAGKVIALAALLAFPSAFFMHVFYSEAVFMAIGFWAYYFALNKSWARTGLLLALLTAARLPALLFVALCALEYLRAYQWSIKKAYNRNVLWFLLSPLGFVAYGTYLHVVRQDFFAMFHAYSATSDWTYQQFSPNIFATVFNAVQQIISSGLTYGAFINQLLPLLALACIVIASTYSLWALKKDGIPLAVFGLLASVLFTLNNNVVSAHRYALPVVTIYVALGIFSTRHPKRSMLLIWLLIAASSLVQLYLYWKFTHGIFAG